ncbi:molecular chaperone [Devosia sp.]|uniref:TorD/DmsD family molecular chaperone n=1 Tax=Devosia sp. TaxID=1871048 RepID=UPI0027325C68|nr:molecular chaperone TorD family protein [Devosia sp.]MDP2781639.1 molecular chaperone TorD family protein [Devosia sp.]
MSAHMTGAAERSAIAEEDLLRARLYRLLARFLARPPSREELALAAAMSGDHSELGKAVQAFSEVAARQGEDGVAQEFHDLFIGLGRGELLPYESYYLTGFLHEKPLAQLRRDMEALGIAGDESSPETEDHIAALMDMMAGLIEGSFGAPADIATQKKFFDHHVGSWAKHFFRELEGAKSSVLYATLGQVGRVFMDIEEVAFSMD